jgi:hypothetical protein
MVIGTVPMQRPAMPSCAFIKHPGGGVPFVLVLAITQARGKERLHD